MISVIILSQMRQKLQQSDQSVKRKVATKLKPVSISSGFSKIYEKFPLEKPFINTFLSKFIAAYRENYSSSHVLIENWKQALDENFVVGTVHMDSPRLLTVFHMTY